jgi:NAD(P)-dependent dehydrogenase (short-subunit alcohol dehydrogenase family)
MTSISLNSSLLQNLVAKTVVITGGANGIGGCTVRHCHLHGANVVIADLPSAHLEAENLIASLSDHSRALFVPVNIAVWAEMQALFSTAVGRYGSVDIVIANAGVMESRDFFDFEIDDEGQLIEDLSVGKVIDVNLKGAMNS